MRIIKDSCSFRLHESLILVDLTEPDPKQYEAIIRQKHKVIQASKNLGQSFNAIIPDGTTQQSREIDEFGEIAVKRLEQPHRRDFSDADVEKIISSYKSGRSTIELARQFACSKNTINKLLRDHGVEVIKAKAQAKLDAKAVVAMYAEMHTAEEIAKRFDAHRQVVIRCLKANGVKIRNRWDYVEK